jgi:hypothetical protein
MSKPKKEPVPPDPIEHEPLTRVEEAIAIWHKTPGNRQALAALLRDPVLSLALSTLQVAAQVVPNKSADLTLLALAMKRAEGYQECLNDLRRLADSPATRPRRMPEQFSYLTQTATTTSQS